MARREPAGRKHDRAERPPPRRAKTFTGGQPRSALSAFSEKSYAQESGVRREAVEAGGVAGLLAVRDPLGGSWAGIAFADADRRIATSFALLFLAAAWGDAQ